MFKKPIRTNKNNKPLGEKGFTLVELLISVALLAISVGISSDIIVSLVRTFGKTQVLNDTEQTVNFVFLKMQNDLKNSITAETTPDGNTLTLTKQDYGETEYHVTATAPPQLERDGIPLIDTDSAIGGVTIACAGDCFEVVTTDPFSVKINLTFSQTSGAGIFDTTVSIEDTFVVRGSY
jgi:prepilin-type N-terminal cleavage/methylation domain-containing protein